LEVSLGDALGMAALLLVVASGAVWFRRLNAVRIPESRKAFVASMGAGAVLGCAAFAVGSGALGSVSAVVAIGVGLMFVLLRAASAMDAKQPAVRVGDPVIDFEAPDEDGRPFDLASLRGRPFLLKFFRGHW